jgi:hypothetical protein
VKTNDTIGKQAKEEIGKKIKKKGKKRLSRRKYGK